MAAEKGDEYVQYNLGVLYRDGSGVPQDLPEGVRWMHKAAKQGHAEAKHDLSLIREHDEQLLRKILANEY